MELEKKMEKEIKLMTLIARYTDIPQGEAVDLVLWTYCRKITQEVIDFVEAKLNRGEIVEEIDILDYIHDLITEMDKEQNQY